MRNENTLIENLEMSHAFYHVIAEFTTQLKTFYVKCIFLSFFLSFSSQYSYML